MRVLKFTGLKVLEIGVFLLYGEGSFHLVNYLLRSDAEWHNYPLVAQYFGSIALVTFFLLSLWGMIYLLWQLMKKNWEWAE